MAKEAWQRRKAKKKTGKVLAVILGAGFLTIVGAMVSPRTTHAIVATLVQVVNTTSQPVVAGGTRLIQNTVMAGSVFQIQTDGQLGFVENLVPVCCHVLFFFISRSPFHCALSASIVGSVSHPVGDRPSRNLAFLYAAKKPHSDKRLTGLCPDRDGRKWLRTPLKNE
jgi:hypothetical protein